MSRRVLQLSTDLVDETGQARFTHSEWEMPAEVNSAIAPWLDMDAPPTPPPKPYPVGQQHQLQQPSSSTSTSRSFGFGSKNSLSSLVSLRQGSASSVLRSNGGSSIRSAESQHTLSVPESKRRSADDSESSRGAFYSGSSTNSGEVHKSKSYNIFSKLKTRQSKGNLRSESDDSEHPSLRPPVPPVPQQRYPTPLVFNGGPGANVSTPTIGSVPVPISSKSKHAKIKKKSGSSKLPPSPPPKDDFAMQSGLVPNDGSGIVDFSADQLEGIVDFNIASASGSITSVLPPANGTRGNYDANSPSSGFDSSQSYSDHGSYNNHYFVPPSEFRNPFSATSLQDPHSDSPTSLDPRKVSPKSINPPPPNGFIARPNGIASSSPDGPGSPSWAAPDSWAVDRGLGDYYNIPELSEGYDTDSDGANTAIGWVNGKVRQDDRSRRRAKNVASASFSSTTSMATRGSKGNISRLSNQPPPGATYKMRMYTPRSAYHVIAIDLDTTVASLTAKLSKRIEQTNGRVQLYLKEHGRERILGPNEKPAAIVKLRMEQAGYEYEDGMHLLGTENLNILLRFVYKAQLLAGEEPVNFSNYKTVDLSGKGLRVIPPILHKNAEQITSLRLSRNPMIEIPLDFIQSCTRLRELRLTHMSMKKVPQSVPQALTLHRLDISSNAIRDLEDAILDPIPELRDIQASNNRLDKLPWHFARLKSITTLNISNNKFRDFPLVLTQILTLRDLDISFNMVTELPEEIGLLTGLEMLILVGNQVSRFPSRIVELVKLKALDIRRNQISDLSLVCGLPGLTSLSADHNTVHALDLALGPRMKHLVASHNDITQLTLSPSPQGRLPYALLSLDLSYAKLYSLDELALSQLSSLRVLKLDHNSIRSIPDNLGDLKWLENLSCTDNKLDSLPSTIGRLQYLKTLDAHNNNLNDLPQTLWECASLRQINVTSNFINSWPDPPLQPSQEPCVIDGSLAAPVVPLRKGSVSSISSTRSLPPLVNRLEKLYIGENCLTDNSVLPLMIFKELKVLNLSFNEIQDLPPSFFRNMTLLEELYLSGNKLTSVPSEDLPRLHKLSTIFLNGNRLVTLPQELGKVVNLTVLDVGSNYLKYNVNNLEFDWNWNFNENLKYLNLSGNKRLQIKAESAASLRTSRHCHMGVTSGFTSLQNLKVLGLMDVTITHTSQDATVDIPDENMDRRVRTSLSTVCGMGYGIADSMGKNDSLTMIDLVHEFHGRQDEAIFAMIGRTHPPKHLKQESSPNRLTKYLHDNFVNVFKAQLAAVNSKLEKEGVPQHQRKDGIPKALIWTFLKLNQDLHDVLQTTRKNSQASLTSPSLSDGSYSRTGVSGIAVYFFDRTLYAANVGDALAVVSRQGICHEISRKHDPFDRSETIRIRTAEGSISPTGLVNDEVEVSRSFGYFHLFPPINARPDVFVYDLSDMDEFVIIANRGLWDFVPYQTAVDIARTVARADQPDPMLAAQKLRDFAISYGADGSTMIMVIWVADLFNSPSRSRQPTLDPVLDQSYRRRKPEDVRDRGIKFLDYEIPPPTGHVTLVFTDIRNSTHLWEANPGMPTAMRLHNTLLRRHLRLCGGYEVKTEGDSFMCSFLTPLAAVWWCLTVQVQLLHEEWPLEILECEDGKSIYDSEGRLIARGISVRMGIHSGMPLCEPDLVTHRMDYFGPMVNRSARIQSSALGGQIACSNDIVNEIKSKVLQHNEETGYSKLQNSNAVESIRELGVQILHVGEVKLKGIELPEILSIIYPQGLEGRHDLKETPPDPSASSSRVAFSVPQIQELGMLCLRIEALSTRRLFKAMPDRKGSIQSNPELEEDVDGSHIFYSNPSLLLPPINNNSTEAELMLVLESLSLRISNAINTMGERYGVAPVASIESSALSRTKRNLLDTLMDEAVLDEETLRYISAILERP